MPDERTPEPSAAAELPGDVIRLAATWMDPRGLVSATGVCQGWRDRLSGQSDVLVARAVVIAEHFRTQPFESSSGADIELLNRAVARAQASQPPASVPPPLLVSAAAWAEHCAAAAAVLTSAHQDFTHLGGMSVAAAADGGAASQVTSAQVKEKRLRKLLRLRQRPAACEDCLLRWPWEGSPPSLACAHAVRTFSTLASIAAVLDRWCSGPQGSLPVAQVARVLGISEQAPLKELAAAGLTGPEVETACERLNFTSGIQEHLTAVDAAINHQSARVAVTRVNGGPGLADLPRLEGAGDAFGVLRGQLLLLEALPADAEGSVRQAAEHLRSSQAALQCLVATDAAVGQLLDSGAAGDGSAAAALHQWRAVVTMLCAEGGSAAIKLSSLGGPEQLALLVRVREGLTGLVSLFTRMPSRGAGTAVAMLRKRESSARRTSDASLLPGDALLLVVRFLGGGLAASQARVGGVCRDWRRRLRMAICAAAVSPAALLEDAIETQATALRLPRGLARDTLWSLALLTNEIVSSSGDLLVTRQPDGARARILSGGLPPWLASALPLTEAACAALLLVHRLHHGGGQRFERGAVLELAPAVPVTKTRAAELATLHADDLRALVEPHYRMAETLHTNLLLWVALSVHGAHAEELPALVSLPHKDEERGLTDAGVPLLLMRATQPTQRTGALLRTLLAEAQALTDPRSLELLAAAAGADVGEVGRGQRQKAVGAVSHLLKFGAMHGNVDLWA